MITLKLTTVGNSVGVVLPKEFLARLRVDKGDMIYATETTDGFVVKNYDEGFVKDMEMAERLIHENRNVLKKLADN
ncbi:MAG: AbrB/MazE/SpoVT family DNA-binding domain-containing protein [Rickettsiales bacterium]